MDEVVRLASALAGRPVLEDKDVGRQFMTEEGRRFAYRERAHTPGDSVRPVELVKEGPPRSQKVKVRWLDGEYEGLEEWVPKVRLVVPWDQKEALLEDERRMFAALEASGDVYDTTTYKAVETVFFAIPQEAGAEVWFGMKAIERELLSIDDLDAAATRLGLDAEGLLSEPHSYVDRFGEYRAPFGVAVKVAKHCCEMFSREVLRHLRAEEESYGRSSSPGTSKCLAPGGPTTQPTAGGPRPGWRSWGRSSPSSGSGAYKRPRRSSAR